jgi:ABC-type branched-subunit amino acid transport system substrate-binding protein
MNAAFFRVMMAWVALAALGGCVTAEQWLNSFTVAQKPASKEAPVPDAAPATPVDSVHIVDAPTSPTTPRASAPILQTQMPAPTQQRAAKVAILVPLSGKNAEIGKAMLNAAQMAVFDMSAESFELMPRDTGDKPETATAAARDAIANGAQLIIGPLFATQAPAVKMVTDSAGVSMLTLSTDTSLAAPGMFVMGFAPDAQVERVVKFAAAQRLTHYAALVPDTAYGKLVAQVFRQAVAHYGGTVVDVESYNPAHGAAKAIHALAAKQRQIQALFLPEGGIEIEKIADQLLSAGFDNRRTHLLGTGLWDEVDLGRRVRFLDGGWYAASDPTTRQKFVAGYQRTYGAEPPRIATLAYDATALAAVLARRGAGYDRGELTNPNGFAGIDGIFRLTAGGLVERGLAVNEVTAEGDQIIAMAPTTFAGR